MYIHQSDLAAWNRCPTEWRYQREGMPGRQLSATAYGSVWHHAVHVMERTGDLQAGLDTFTHYWHPLNIETICPPVQVWINRDTYGGLARKGLDTLRRHWDLLQYDDSELLALEYEFAVPVAGTLDRDTGGEHVLVGSIDRLAIRRHYRKPYISVEDYKTGKQKNYLRHNVQGTAYCYASTRPEFWTGWAAHHTSGFPEGQKLQEIYAEAPRRFWWINANTGTWVDGGWRTRADYERLARAIQAVADSIQADIYPLSLDGEVCQFCSYRTPCLGEAEESA